jgi:diguanylate cyclase (GGDEF)-like protein/PAS domain S-box-containing protein
VFAGQQPEPIPHSLRRDGLLRRFAPFGAVSLLAVGLLPAIPGATHRSWFVVAAVLTAAVSAAGLMVPWERISLRVSMVVPLMAVAAAAAARAALGSHGWAYDTIVLLPIMWVALYESRFQLVAVLIETAVSFVLPLLIRGGTGEISSEVVGAALLLAIAVTVGVIAQELVANVRRTTNRLSASELRFRKAFEQAPLGIAVLELDGTMLECNAALVAIVGLDEEHLIGVNFGEVARPDDQARDSEQFRQLLAGEIPSFDSRRHILIGDGKTAWVENHTSLLHGEPGGPQRLLVQVQDVTQRRAMQGQLEFEADHDPMTGLLNRRGFGRELDRHIEHVRRYGPVGRILLIDLDGLKRLNDTEGHHAGDQAILRTAQTLRERFRHTDVVGRLGGDEFAVLLPQASQDQAVAASELFQSASRRDISSLGPALPSSIGIADFALPGVTASQVLHNADRAMYVAKGGGGDSAVTFMPATPLMEQGATRVGWLDRVEGRSSHEIAPTSVAELP